jgi:hypothetical protein
MNNLRNLVREKEGSRIGREEKRELKGDCTSPQNQKLCHVSGDDIYELTQTPPIAELDRSGYCREQSIVFAEPNVLSGLIASAALSHDYGAASHYLAREDFDSQPLRIRVAPVFRTS